MSKIIVAFYRNDFADAEVQLHRRASKLGTHLLKSNNVSSDFTINTQKYGVLGVFPQNDTLPVNNLSLVAGCLEVLPVDWFREYKKYSSSFQVFTNEEECIVSTNSTASRSVWYYFDENLFIVSTSQRAIVAWLSSFKSEPQAISWMLSCGNLGPGYSWDKRIRHLLANEKLIVSRKDWSLKLEFCQESRFEKTSTKEDTKDFLNGLLSNTFKKLFIPLNSTKLALSGGYDSRTVLYYLVKNNFRVSTLTWGLADAIIEAGTDSNIAQLVASKLNVESTYYETNFREKSFENIFNKFLLSGEGRLDHINSFMDGFAMWEELYKKGLRNVIRADETFGWLPCQTIQDVRISIDMHIMEDNSNMNPLTEFGFETQLYPPFTWRKENESLETWRDRLYREFRIPFVLTGLHDLISPYVEVFNPLLHDDIVDFCVRMPDHLRTNKKLYAELVPELIPEVPIAKKASIPEPASILKSSRIVSLMLDELSSSNSKKLYSNEFISWVQHYLNVSDKYVNSTNDGFSLWLKSHIPWKLKKFLRRDLIKYQADFNQLAFRAVIISKMYAILEDDANLFSND
jgi:asparagine synthetase B (glutamine-hydrolysing)